MGGEHAFLARHCGHETGSSPRGRGTRGSRERAANNERFIPAWAGNTSRRLTPASAAPVHPRVGGEHVRVLRAVARHSGSSPRGRGTPLAVAEIGVELRFIPAWAGNTPGAPRQYRARAVHPRVGGEHLGTSSCTIARAGSSPRGRGTRSRGAAEAPGARFIPAWAGNTLQIGAAEIHRAVHPRVGGEHARSGNGSAHVRGSSPRGRGTP